MHDWMLRLTVLLMPSLLWGAAAALAQTPGGIGPAQPQAGEQRGMKAVTIRTDASAGVAAYIEPGDRVDVLLMRTRGGSSPDKGTYVDVLLQSVRVLAVDELAERKGHANAGRAVTIEVTAEDAARVALAIEVGTLAFGLPGSRPSTGDK